MTDQTKNATIVEMTDEELKDVRGGGAFNLGMTGSDSQSSSIIWADWDRDIRDRELRSTN